MDMQISVFVYVCVNVCECVCACVYVYGYPINYSIHRDLQETLTTDSFFLLQAAPESLKSPEKPF